MKLVAIDLDGTLLNSNAKISKESKEYLMKLKDEGNIIVIATGRTCRSALIACEGAEFANYIISSSGASIYDRVNKKILFIKPLLYETLKKISNLYNSNVKYIEFNDLKYHNKFYEKDIEISSNSKKIENLNEFIRNKNDILQVCLIFETDEEALKANEYIKSNIPEVYSYTVRCKYSKCLYIEIMMKGTSKYSSLSYVSKINNINENNIIAIGDSENDLDMIKNIKESVAMYNAVDVLKENAKYIAKSNDENGVIEFLKEYFND